MSAEGGLSTFYAEPIASKWFPLGGSINVRAVREATLSADLKVVEDRALRSIRVHIGGETLGSVDLSREAATFLRDALAAALEQTADDPLPWSVKEALS